MRQPQTSAARVAFDEATLDVPRTGGLWYQRFFGLYPAGRPEEVLAGLDATRGAGEGALDLGDIPGMGMYGWAYWKLYLVGYLQYRREGLEHDNPYLDYLHRTLGGDVNDPGLRSQLTDRATAHGRVLRRFEDADRFIASPGSPGVDPVLVVVATDPPYRADFVYFAGVDCPAGARALDGYHRVFLATLCGSQTIPCRVLVEPATLPPYSAVITEARARAGRLTLLGSSDRVGAPDMLELRLGRDTLGWSAPLPPPETDPSHAGSLRFAFECDVIPPDRYDALSIVAWNGFRPVALGSVAIDGADVVERAG